MILHIIVVGLYVLHRLLVSTVPLSLVFFSFYLLLAQTLTRLHTALVTMHTAQSSSTPIRPSQARQARLH